MAVPGPGDHEPGSASAPRTAAFCHDAPVTGSRGWVDPLFGLAAAVFTFREPSFDACAERLRVGCVGWNSPTVGSSSRLPFGGVKGTGNGHREGGWAPYEFFSEVKTVYVDYSGGLQRAQIDNRQE